MIKKIKPNINIDWALLKIINRGINIKIDLKKTLKLKTDNILIEWLIKNLRFTFDFPKNLLFFFIGKKNIFS